MKQRDARTGDMQKIRSLLEGGEIQAARRLCMQLCQQYEGDLQILFLMAAIHGQLGEFADVERCCSRIVSLRPASPVAHMNRGIALQNLKRLDEAIDSHREAIRHKPDLVAAHVNLGDVLMASRKLAQACDAYQKAVDLRPDMPELYIKQAIAHRMTGDLPSAERSLQSALQIDPESPFAMLELGHIRVARRQFPEAIEAYRQAMKTGTTCKDACQGIGNIEMYLGNIDAAVRSYEKALEIEPGDVANRLVIARILESTGSLERAEVICREGLRNTPDNTSLLLELGKVISGQGRADEASACFRSVQSLDPGNAEAAYLLSEFEQGRDPHIARQDHIAEMFDHYAESFETHLVDQLGYHVPEQLWQIVCDNRKTEPAGLEVLDLGCGTGLCGKLFRAAAGRLVGVDLSSRMIEVSRKAAKYDELYTADIADYLESTNKQYDVVLAADVFIYVGNLARVFPGCSKVLRRNGLFAFSFESVGGDSFALRSSGRYGQSMPYIQAMAVKHHFTLLEARETVIRTEGHQPIPGYVVLLAKGPD